MRDKLTSATGPDRLILIAGVLFFVNSFLPWYGIRFAGIGGANISGWNSGGLAVIAILCGIAATVFAVIRVLNVKLDLPVNDGVLFLALGGGAFGFALLRLLTQTSFTKFGLYIAIVLGAVIAIGGFRKFQTAQQG